MTRLNNRVYLTLSLLLTMWILPGCQQEEDFPTVDNEAQEIPESEKFIADQRVLGTIATFNEVKGALGESFLKDYNGQAVVLNDLSDYDPKVAGFIHFDVDRLKFNAETFDEIRNWADANDASLIFESGSQNHAAMKDFYLAVFTNDSYVDYDVKGLVIENSGLSNVTRTTVISDAVSISTDAAIKTFFSGMQRVNRVEAVQQVGSSTSISYPDKTTRCMRGRCTTTYGTPLYTVTNGFKAVPNSSSTYDYRASSVSYSNMDSNVEEWGAVDREVIKWGARIHDSKLYDGTYTCNQTASYTESESYSRSWSVGIKVDAKTDKIGSALKSFLKELAFSASGSIGGSHSQGTGYGTSLRMTRRYARTAVYASRFQANVGYWTGNVTYKLQRKKKSGLRRTWQTYANVKSNFNQYAYDNEWEGDQPYAPNNNKQTLIAFGWHEWNPPGEAGPNCGSNGRFESGTVAKSHASWWN